MQVGRLEKKIAIVTGAASGIGRGIARRFAEEGASVVVADVDAQGGEETVRDLRETGVEAVFIHTDVSQGSQVQRMVSASRDRFGRLDVLVNNAGLSPNGSVTETSEEEWDSCLGTNLRGVFLGCKHAIPLMLEGGGGSIINIAGTLGFMGKPRKAAYCASKGGVINLTRQMAIDYGKQNVRINCISPGFVATALTAHYSEEVLEQLYRQQPVGRAGQPDDVAEAAVYLASDAAGYVTGTSLVVDGGVTLSIPS
ncbi:SDR family NAD(P)-dependent oxidoreductase [Chloroflexota bacterium]